MYGQQTGFGMQQQQALPFPPNQIVQPYLNLGINVVPHAPRISMDPQLQQMVPLISAICAMEIQKRVQEQQYNPLRVFMFNMYSQNNYMNQAFEALLAAVLDFVWAKTVTGQYPNLDVAVQDATPKMVELICAMQLVQFPQLEQFTDPNLQQGARGHIATFQNVAAEIQAIKAQRGTMVGQQAPMGGMQMGGAWGGQQMGYTQSTYGGVQRSYGTSGSWSPPAPVAGPALGPNSSTVFGGNRQIVTNVGSADKPAMNPGRYNQDIVRPQPVKEEPVVQHQPTPAPAPQETARAEEQQLLSPRQIKWRPGAWPYIPAYNPQELALFFTANPDGTFTPVFKNRKDLVDFNAHAVPYTFGPPPKGADMTRIPDNLERIQKGVETISAQKDLPPENTDEPNDGAEKAVKQFTKVVRDNWWSETSEQGAWIQAGLERLRVRLDGQVPDIYRMYAKISEVVVGDADESPYLENFSESETFIELREKLQHADGSISAALWAVVNSRMTRAVNRALKQNMSLPTLSIESFAEDIEDLIAVLGKRYGDTLKDAFLKHQKELIDATLHTLNDEDAEVLYGYLVSDVSEYPEDEHPKLTFVTSNVSFTILNVRAHELGVDLGPTGTAVINRSFLPVLHELLKQLFEGSAAQLEKNIREGRVETDFARHLIRTIDGRVLEATQGYLGDDCYLLSLVE